MNDIFLAEESCGPKHQKFITICDQCVKGTCLQFYFNLVIQEYIFNEDSYMYYSGSDAGSTIEPIAAVPLNDELQESRALVAKAELDVLSKLTDKVLKDGLFDFIIFCSLMFTFYLTT